MNVFTIVLAYYVFTVREQAKDPISTSHRKWLLEETKTLLYYLFEPFSDTYQYLQSYSRQLLLGSHPASL